MTKIRIENGYVRFKCPGCNDTHLLNIDPANRPCWGFNGNVEKPTLTPSILTTSGHYVSGHQHSDPCWCQTAEASDRADGFHCYRCHSFVTDGMIQFLSDCSHELAGQTVPLKDVQ